ncbi:MarR family winged helix-turn-helix transcriptional regulator [Endothiovibrio diazotrophicus]
MNRSKEVLIAIRKIIRAIDLQSKRLMSEAGVTGPQLLVMQAVSQLRERGRHPSLGEIAKRVSLSQATVTSIMGRLEAKGLALRSKGSDDRRRMEVTLTAAGEEALRRAPNPLQESFVEAFEGLQAWEQHLLISSLERVADMMGAADIEAAPVLETEGLAKDPSLQ